MLRTVFVEQLEIIKRNDFSVQDVSQGKSLLKTKDSLGDLRGKMHDYRGISLMVTYHPAGLAQESELEKPCWRTYNSSGNCYEQMKKQ